MKKKQQRKEEKPQKQEPASSFVYVVVSRGAVFSEYAVDHVASTQQAAVSWAESNGGNSFYVIVKAHVDGDTHPKSIGGSWN